MARPFSRSSIRTQPPRSGIYRAFGSEHCVGRHWRSE
jgi:hypothetical protein